MSGLLKWVDVREQSRTYVFPAGSYRIEKVARLCVSNSTHRIETSDGRKFIVPNGWLAIELEVDQWTV